ncbi:MAG: alpha/beta fold hydrolase, partial [Candidatus Eiseniibacteriota bacterium]
MNESSFNTKDGLKIFTRSWMPKAAPRAVIVLVHGFNAHSGYMSWAGEQFAAHGLAAYALDLRGRGRSGGERFFIEKFSDYTDDVDGLVEIARSANPGLPVYMLGHSAGGVVASTYVFEHQDTMAGLVCESFALDVGVPDAAALLIKGLSHLAPHLHVYTLKNEIFSRDPAVVAAMNADPLIAKESQPAETSAELIRAAEQLKVNMPKYRVPI